MNNSLTTFLIVAKRALAALLGIVAIAVAAWAFPRSGHRPLIASHVLIGLVVVIASLSLGALLAFVGPVPQKAPRDIWHPARRQPSRHAVALTHRQRRRLKR